MGDLFCGGGSVACRWALMGYNVVFCDCDRDMLNAATQRMCELEQAEGLVLFADIQCPLLGFAPCAAEANGITFDTKEGFQIAEDTKFLPQDFVLVPHDGQAGICNALPVKIPWEAIDISSDYLLERHGLLKRCRNSFDKIRVHFSYLIIFFLIRD